MRLIKSRLFWTKQAKLQIERQADPLGIDVLREAMAGVLAPCLTKGTSSADEYLWVLVGLGWANRNGAAGFEMNVWPSFQRFERGLKLYWWRNSLQRHFNGSRKAKLLCARGEWHPNLTEPLLSNERGAGLLGIYLRSLRKIGLVEKRTLRLSDKGEDVIQGLDFAWDGQGVGSWAKLYVIFSKVRFQVTHRRRLGVYLFADATMRSSAEAWKRRRSSRGWPDLVDMLSLEQKKMAKACGTVNKWAETANACFTELLGGRKNIPKVLSLRLKRDSSRTLKADPFPVAWGRDGLADILRQGIRGMSEGVKTQCMALIKLHSSVVSEQRGRSAWISRLGQKSLVEYRPPNGDDDYRFKNLKHLLVETRWHALK